MKILSLFDGMACGMLAMQRERVNVEQYIAYEIDKYAIKTAQHNFPQIEEMGDVFKADFTQYEGVDFLVGGSPCFTAGHMVLTDKGYRDISEIEIGDMVLTHKNRFMPVTRLYERKASTVSLKIQGYKTFTTTSNHPFYAIQRAKTTYSEYKKTHSWRKFSARPDWVKVSDMTPDTFCGQNIHTTAGVNEYSLTAEECYILGRYVADGHLRNVKRKGRKNSYQYQVVLSIGDDKLKEFLDNISENHCSCYAHGQAVHRCVFSSKRLVEIAVKFGRGAGNKEIPEFIFDLPDNLIGRFIDGYMAGDGSYINQWDEYIASTVSYKLALGFQRLIGSYYHTNVGISCAKNDRVSNIGGRKIKGNYPLYTICFKKGLKKQSVAYIQDGIIWTNVKSIGETGNVEIVYNIEVAEDHSYTVNNCIVHNCTYWSIAQNKNRETEASGLGWDLFCQYVRALHEAKPKFFIYENNKSMSKAIRDSIRETFGFEEICINSALVSAQNRQRYYWVGKRNEDGTYSKVDVQQPIDRGILLKDILDGWAFYDKSRCVTASVGRTTTRECFKKNQNTMATEPVRIGTYPGSRCPECDSKQYRIYSTDGKACTLRSTCYKDGIRNLVGNNVDRKTAVAESIFFEANYDIIPGCDLIVGEHKIRQADSTGTKQGKYVYIDGLSKSNTITSGQAHNEKTLHRLPWAEPTEWDESGNTVTARSGADGKTYTVYEVKNGMITIKGKTYPVKLVDGYWIIRKLTVSECKRLQTVPEWYDFSCVSNTQAYKMLGNGWTVEVIAHLIRACL